MQRIEIENFGPITHAEIDIAQIVLLIGEQASGKSTTAKLIYFFKSLKEDFFSIITNKQNKDFANYFHYFSKKIKAKFILLFPFVSENDSFLIRFFYSDSFSIEIRKKIGKPIKININGVTNEIKTKLSELNKLIEQYNEIDIFIPVSPKYIMDFLEDLFQDKLSAMFVPAGRNITVTYSREFKLLFFGELSKQFDKLLDNRYDSKYSQEYSADTFLMKEYLQEIERIIDYFEDWDFNEDLKYFKGIEKERLRFVNQAITNTLKGEYVQDNTGEKIVYGKNKDAYVQLHNASSGQQEVIRILQDLYILLRQNKNVFRVIEEPEAHLYPVAQKNLIELMATVVNNSESQIIITTHSPYILSVFNNLLYATKVAELNKSKQKEVNEIIPEFAQLNPNEFRAYSLKNKSKTYIDDDLRYCEPIFDKETGMIAQNYLDDVSEELGDDFDQLYNIHTQSL